MGDELGRGDEPVGSLPSDESLDGLDLARVHPDDRLIVHDDLVALERGLEVPHDAAVERQPHHRFLARVALRRVHLAVGPREQLARCEPVLREERPADRRIDLDQAAVDAIRPAECVAESSHEHRGFVVCRRAEREHDEFVPSDARDRVDAADHALETLRDHAEDDVPHLVPADVVDALEPVEIDDEERERLCRALRPRERLRDPIVQQRAVREARQWIAQHGPLSHHEVARAGRSRPSRRRPRTR